MIDLRPAKKWIIPAISVAVIFAAGVLVCRGFFPKSYGKTVTRCAGEFGVEEDLIYAVIHTESGFKPKAQSHAGAVGLMQLMPETFGWLQTKLQPGLSAEDGIFPAGALEDPEINVRYGTFYLSLLLREFGDERLAIAAYHAGQNRVRGWLNDGAVTPGGDISEIPSSVTAHYVTKVERAKKIYQIIY